MNKKTEALKDLLEVIEHAIEIGDWKVDGRCDPDLAINRAKEALEQPAQTDEYTEGYQQGYVEGWEAKKAEQPAQEPVAWMMVNREPETGAAYLTFEKPTRVQKISHHPHELYTHPTPSWQGLSDDEMKDIQNNSWIIHDDGSKEFNTFKFARAIEQALKERNT